MSDRFQSTNIHGINRVDIGRGTLDNWLRLVLWNHVDVEGAAFGEPICAIEVERPVHADWINICTEISAGPMPTHSVDLTMEFFAGADVRFNERPEYKALVFEQTEIHSGVTLFLNLDAPIVWHG